MYPAATTFVSPSKKNSESVFDECSEYQGEKHLVASAQTNPFRLSEQVVCSASSLSARLFDKQVLASLWWKSEEDKHFSSITKEECGCTDMTFDP
jgi:hypothetical protein